MSLSVSLNEHWTKIYFLRHMFLSGYLKSRVEQFYSGYLVRLLTTGNNKRTSRWEILHQKITWLWKGKLLGLGSSPSFRTLLAPRISRGHFFLAVFFRVTHDGLSERGITRSLPQLMDTGTNNACTSLSFRLDVKSTFNCFLVLPWSNFRYPFFTFSYTIGLS